MLPDALAGVPVTALGVALVRMNESARPDALFDDPFAARFIRAAEPEFTGPAASVEAARTWAMLLRMAPVMVQRAVSVRFLETCLLDAVAGGCDQVVEVGAGLDTYAQRLPWPRLCRFFEVDLPQMFAFKERVLGAASAAPACDRRVVPADVLADWQRRVADAGWDGGVPTVWLDGGVVDYLPRDRARALIADIASASPPGSRFVCVLPAPPAPVLDGQLTRVVGAGRERAAATGFGPDLGDWFGAHGWQVEVHDHAEVAVTYGRPEPDGGRGGSGYLVAALP